MSAQSHAVGVRRVKHQRSFCTFAVQLFHNRVPVGMKVIGCVTCPCQKESVLSNPDTRWTEHVVLVAGEYRLPYYLAVAADDG